MLFHVVFAYVCPKVRILFDMRSGSYFILYWHACGVWVMFSLCAWCLLAAATYLVEEFVNMCALARLRDKSRDNIILIQQVLHRMSAGASTELVLMPFKSKSCSA